MNSREKINELLRISMGIAMANAQERLMQPKPRRCFTAELRTELREYSPIVVLEKQFRARDFAKASTTISEEVRTERIGNITRNIRVLNRWIGRFGAKGGSSKE